MNKKVIIALTGLAAVLIGCNSGGETLVGVYLPSGTYNTIVSNANPPACKTAIDGIFGSTITSNGTGTITSVDGLTSFSLNIANNPCLSKTEGLDGGGSATISLSSCEYNMTSGDMTADVSLTSTLQSAQSCTADIEFQKQ